MYYLYEINDNKYLTSFKLMDTIKIFGSVNGLIVKILKYIIPKGKYHSLKCKINFDKDLLYKIDNIFGNSDSGWTPMMFHLKSLFVDKEGTEEDKNCFSIDLKKQDNIFTFHHVYNGFIENGKIEGKWTPPRPSSTNSALLWDDTFEYFIECKKNASNKP